MKTNNLLTILVLFIGLQITHAQHEINRGSFSYKVSKAESNTQSNWELNPQYLTQNNLVGIHFTDDHHGWAIAEGGIIIYTEDAGQTWEMTELSPAVHLYDIFFVNNEMGFVVGKLEIGPIARGVIYQTIDGGENWNLSFSTDANAQFNNITFSSSEYGFVTGQKNTAEGLKEITMVTSNGGDSWEQVNIGNPGLSISHIEIVNENDLWGVGRLEIGPNEVDVIVKSNNSGETWGTSYIAQENINFTSLSFSDADHGIVAGDHGFILTTCDGALWNLHLTDQNHFNEILSAGDCNGLVIGDEGLILNINDNGQNIAQDIIPFDNNLNALCSTSGGTLWIAGNDGIILKKRPTKQKHTHNFDLDENTIKNSQLIDQSNQITSSINILSHKNYPNPFVGETTIAFDLVSQRKVSLNVYDINGRLVAAITNNSYEAGCHEFKFDGSHLQAGLYSYVIVAGKQMVQGKMMIGK